MTIFKSIHSTDLKKSVDIINVIVSFSEKSPIKETFHLKGIFLDEQLAKGNLNLSEMKVVALQ